MDSIDKMMDEHAHILRFTKVIRAVGESILGGGTTEAEDFRQMIYFARTYADAYHHGKEEKILFEQMIENIGPFAEQIIKHGMVVEHDLGRMFIYNTEQAVAKYEIVTSTSAKLDMLVNMVAWADLLERHIAKEDRAIYQFARREMSSTALAHIHSCVKEFEEGYDRAALANCENILVDLEAKYK